MPTKKNTEIIVEPAITKGEQKKSYGAAHTILLIYLGIFTLTIDEIEKLSNRLIKQGETAEQNVHKRLHEVMDKRMEKAHQNEDGKHPQTRWPLASKSDIDIVNERINRFSAEFDKFLEGAEVSLPEPPG